MTQLITRSPEWLSELMCETDPESEWRLLRFYNHLSICVEIRADDYEKYMIYFHVRKTRHRRICSSFTQHTHICNFLQCHPSHFLLFNFQSLILHIMLLHCTVRTGYRHIHLPGQMQCKMTQLLLCNLSAVWWIWGWILWREFMPGTINEVMTP